MAQKLLARLLEKRAELAQLPHGRANASLDALRKAVQVWVEIYQPGRGDDTHIVESTLRAILGGQFGDTIVSCGFWHRSVESTTSSWRSGITSTTNLLRGMIRCGCGRLMAGRMMVTGYSYYGCTHRSSSMSSLEEVCREKEIRTDRLEAVVWKYISDVMTDPARFEKALRDAQATEMAALEPKQDQLATIKKLIEKCETDASKFANALANVTEGAVSKALLDQVERIDSRFTIHRSYSGARCHTKAVGS